MKSIAQRVQQICVENHGKRGQTQFAKRLRIAPQTVNHYFKGGTPGAEVLARISEEYAVSLKWLITGQGQKEDTTLDEILVRLKPQDRLDELHGRLGAVIEEARDLFKEPATKAAEPVGRIIGLSPGALEKLGRMHPEDFVTLKLLSDRAAAGEPRAIDEREIEDYIIMYADWVPNPDKTTCVRIKGKSMHPVIPDGSLVAIDQTERDPRQLEGRIVAAVVEEGVAVKWLHLAGEDLVLSSENREFGPMTLRPSELDRNPIIGKVIWTLNRFF